MSAAVPTPSLRAARSPRNYTRHPLGRLLLAAASVAAIPCLAHAQAFNIEFGDQPTGSVPPANFGAASGQLGVWNTYTSSPANNLLDTSGNTTAVNLTATNAFTTFNAGFNDPLTTGADELLMDDYIGLTFIETFTLTGLAPGAYDVYTYTWTFGPLSTGVDVNTTGQQIIGGTWPGGYLLGTTHSLHSVTLAANQPLNIHVVSINGALGAITGVQIIPIPTPSAAALLLAAPLLTRRRR